MIYGVGETVLDIIFRSDKPQSAVPGGSTFNSMISLGRCGLDCAMLAQTGDDHVGDMTMNYLRENGVGTHLMTRCVGMKSHISLAFLNAQSDANYTFYKDHNGWSLAPLLAAADSVQFTADDVLLFGSFFAVNPLVRPVVEILLRRAHAAGALVYYDINYRAPHAAMLDEIRPYMDENIRLASVVRGSMDDFRIAFGLDTPDAVFEMFRETCRTLIVTDGAHPIHVYAEDLHLCVPSAPIEPISTVGAGDNFNAGFIRCYAQSGLHADTACWTERNLLDMVNTGQAFAQEVCQSWENSIAKR